MPLDIDNDLHNAPDWQPFVKSRVLFGSAYADSNISTHLLDKVWEALQRQPEADAVESDLTHSLRDPPSLAEFKHGIQMSKSSSAPGMSGLSYNMLKSLPDRATEYYHACFAQFWISD